MFTKTEKRGNTDIFIATIEEIGNGDGGSAVSSRIGYKEVCIKSNLRTNGAIYIIGPENLRLVRDAMVKICEMEDIA